jgi:hypothetical protein
MIWIDDHFDCYRETHTEIFETIKKQHLSGDMTKEKLIMFLRDMIGLNNSIEMNKIFKFHFNST